MKYIYILLLVIFTGSVLAQTVTHGKIKHNGLDHDGNLETIHQSIVWGGAVNTDWYYTIGENFIPNLSYIHKYGFNGDIDASVAYEVVWGGGGPYTGFNATAAETIEISSADISDVGALVSSGTVTLASENTLVDSEATFISDGVAVGDVVLNDTDRSHGIITDVGNETTLTVFSYTKTGAFLSATEIGDSYRIATAASTGAAVMEIKSLLDGDLDNETSEYLILNGTTWVDTVGTYRRASRGSVILAGSGGTNTAVLTVRQKTTTANVFMRIPAGFGHSMIAAWTIPNGLEGHLTGWYVALAGKIQAVCVARLVIRHFGETFVVKELIAVSGNGFKRDFLVPKNDLPPGTDIAIEASCDTNNTGVSAGFDIIYGYHPTE